MNEFWRELLENSKNVTNVKIICSDGIINSHKIIIASVSNFIKHILIDIPVGDQVTLFLPDFQKVEIYKFLDFTESLKQKKDIFVKSNETVFKAEQLFLKQEFGDEEVELDCLKKELHDETENVSNLQYFDTESNFNCLEEECNRMIRIKKESGPKNDKANTGLPRKRYKANREAKLQLKSRFEQAEQYYLTGKTNSVRKAAKMFDVSHTTLTRIIKTGTSYHGRGKRTTIMTPEEEKIAFDKITEKIEELKQELDAKIVKKIAREVVREELESISYHSPDRKGLNTLLENNERLSSFVFLFAGRHNLKKFYPEVQREIHEDLDMDTLYTTVIERRKNSVRATCTKAAVEGGKDKYLDGECAEETENIAKNLIPNPSTPKEIITNEKLQMRILIEKAKSYYLSGQSDSIRETAKKFNIPHTTLTRILKTGTLYQGRGKKTLIFNKEEENLIVERIKEKLKGEQELTHIKTYAIIKETVREEMEIIKVNFPERLDISSVLESSSKLNSFVHRFSNRNVLKRFFPEDKRERNFQCDVCFKTYTLKKHMVKHQQTVHYSFLT